MYEVDVFNNLEPSPMACPCRSAKYAGSEVLQCRGVIILENNCNLVLIGDELLFEQES